MDNETDQPRGDRRIISRRAQDHLYDQAVNKPGEGERRCNKDRRDKPYQPDAWDEAY